MDYFEIVLQEIKKYGLYPPTRTVTSPAVPQVIVNGREVLSFCSNNYLGLATHPRVIEAADKALKKYGTSCGGARLLSGNYLLHEQLEDVIAKFKQTESSMLFMSGYMANTGAIPAFMNESNIYGLSNIVHKPNVIFSDEHNHASIIDGCRLAKADLNIYRHCDPNSLEHFLKKKKFHRKLIVTDGVFSMDGDIAPLKDIAMLARKYDAMLMVDDAHGTGVLGDNGRGSVEYYGVEGEVDILMGTLSKAMGGIGGFIASKKHLIEYLRVTARQFIFSSALPPATTAGLIAAFNVLQEEPEIRVRLWRNVNYISERLTSLGFSISETQTPIIPIIIGDESLAIKFAKSIFEKGLFIPCVRWPAVPEKQARLRCTVTSNHTQDEIEKAIQILESEGKRLGVI